MDSSVSLENEGPPECRCGSGEECGVCFESKRPPDSGGSSTDDPRCECGHARLDHASGARRCVWFRCECVRFRCIDPEEERLVAEARRARDCGTPLTPEEEESLGGWDGVPEEGVELPPAPSRRPPLAVAYGVEGGALFEVLVPGDATVAAVDGQLVIAHPRPVAGIIQIKPYGEETA